MKTIIVVSPSYLDTFFSESEKYSFSIHGYGNAALALKRAIYVNASEILGFVLAYDSFPARTSKEFRDLVRLLDCYDLMGIDKPLIVITRSEGVKKEVALLNLKHLKVNVLDGLEVVSDTVVNKGAFGKILIENYEMYQIFNRPTEKLGNFTGPRLGVTPIIPGFLLEVLSPVHLMQKLEESIEFDIVYKKYKDHNKLVADLREILIREKMHKRSDSLIVRVLESVDKLDVKSRCLHLACLERIVGRVNCR